MSGLRGLPARAVKLSLHALRVRRYRRLALGAVVLYLLIYLLAIRNLILSPGTDLGRFVSLPSVRVAADWGSKVFRQQAPFYYEPVVAIYPINHVTILLSPVNLAMGLLLAGLVGINLAVAFHLVRKARACRRRAFGGLLGALPGFLTGFACCVPTVALVVGAQFTVVLLAVRSYFFPFALASLAASLLWNARRADTLTDERLMQPEPVPGQT